MIMIILTIAFVKFETILPEKTYEKLNFMADDTMNLLEYLEVHEVQNTPTIKDLIEKGELEKRDLNKTVLDLIASFWYKGNYSIAENISRDVLQGLTGNFCVNLTIGVETIYSSCNIPTDKAAVSTRIESGYEPGKPSYGYVAAARLTDIRGKRDSSFVYFGGYVGEGNVTGILNLPPYDEILETYMEMNTNSNFTLYINGNYSGSFANGTAGGGNMTADKWFVCNDTYHPEYCSNFTTGNNTLEFKFSKNDSYIGGGYFRVTYNTNQLSPPEDPNKDWYWFPGIKGFINLYDSFYVPGTLNNMTMRLHYFNNLSFPDYNVPVYVTIADKEVYRSDETGPQDLTLPYDKIWSKFGINPTIFENYISNKTVPITFGTDSFYLTGKGIADAVLITDVSGSMGTCDVSTSSCLHPDCSGNSGCQNERLDVAKDVDKDFIEDILKIEGDRAGLVAYSASPNIRSEHNLTENKNLLSDQISNYQANGCTCISCGVNESVKILSNPTVDKEFIDSGKSWLYNTYYPTSQPPNDVLGHSWNESDFNDSDWSKGNAILGFENIPYYPNVNTNIGNNFVLISDQSYNASSYSLVNASITSGSLSDTYVVDGNTFDILQEGSILGDKTSAQTKTCSCTSNGCYCDITFNNFLGSGCTLDSASIKVNVKGDLDASNEYVTVSTDGTNRGNCCRYRNCGHCLTSYTDCVSYDVTSYASDNSLTVRCDASSSVDECSPRLDCQVNLTWTGKCPKPSGEVRFNSSIISYPELPGSIKTMIKFSSTEAGHYQFLIYNFNTSSWGPENCNGGSVGNGVWNSYWCNKTSSIKNYISNDNKIRVALNGSSDNQATMKIDFVQYYTTIGKGNYFFRKHFNVGDVNIINSASLYVLSDERTEVYLNNQLIDNDTIDHQARYWNRPDWMTYDFEDGTINGWTTGGNANWYATNTIYAEGSWSARSGAIGNSQNTWIKRNVVGPANLTFYWRVSSQENNDYLVFCVDNPSCTRTSGYTYRISGGVSWQEISYLIPVGTHEIIWKYDKDSGTSSGDDAGWVDDVTIKKMMEILIDKSYFVNGDNVVAVKLYNDDGENAKFDLKIVANINETRKKAMLVMSDGYANKCLLGDNCGSYGTVSGCPDDPNPNYPPKLEAIKQACNARDYNNISVYAVAFGSSADTITLKKIACWNCTANDWLLGESETNCPRFYESNDADELKVIYRRVAEEIAEIGYTAQKTNITGAILLENILYPDSYIEYNFTPILTVDPDEHGKVSITREGKRLREFTDEDFITDPLTKTKEGWYDFPEGVTVVDSKITSYSSEFWTDRLLIDSSATTGWTSVYNLSYYSQDYKKLGDPYIIQIPVNYVKAGRNSLRIGSGYNDKLGNILGVGGSPDDRLIYTMRIRGKVGYNETTIFRSLDEAIEDAMRRLNDTIKVYGVYVSDSDIDVDYRSYAGVRSIWGPSLLKVIVWENTTT
jgi:hypothetical protein